MIYWVIGYFLGLSHIGLSNKVDVLVKNIDMKKRQKYIITANFIVVAILIIVHYPLRYQCITSYAEIDSVLEVVQIVVIVIHVED